MQDGLFQALISNPEFLQTYIMLFHPHFAYSNRGNIELPLNEHQNTALQALRERGLTAAHLRTWENSGGIIAPHFFGEAHHTALIFLMTREENPLEPQAAIAEINRLDCLQAEGIANGLCRNEVVDLNGPQIEALQALREHGLTAEHLRSWEEGDGRYGKFHGDHHAALTYLMTREENPLEPQAAIAEINRLTCFQAEGIANELSRSDVIGLGSEQVRPLIKLHERGLTAAHLRSWTEDSFNYLHGDALIHLMTREENPLGPEAAIAEISGLSDAELRAIGNSHLGNFSDFFVDTLTKGLFPANFFSDSHYRTLPLLFFRTPGENPSSSQATAAAASGASRNDAFSRRSLVSSMLPLEAFDEEAKDQTESSTNGTSSNDAVRLSIFEKQAFQALHRHGLTAEHLNSWELGEDIFDEEHRDALIHLMTRAENPLGPEEAMTEINGLNCVEAVAIANGLSRNDTDSRRSSVSLLPPYDVDEEDYNQTANEPRKNDVIDLNEYQISALQTLQTRQLTASHLRSWEGNIFTDQHRAALIHLMTRKENPLNPKAAIAEINQLEWYQAVAIANGLDKNEIVGFNEYQMAALQALETYGLTANHLRSWNGVVSWDSFSEIHRYVLIHLMTREENPLGPEAAIAEINELNPRQVEGVANGLSRNEVIDLNCYKIEVFNALHPSGLTANHLKSWEGNEFASVHRDALIYLMKHEQPPLGPDEAIAEINGLNEHQTRDIANGLRKNDILSFNEFQIQAFHTFHAQGLTANHLRSWVGNEFTSAHLSALFHLVYHREVPLNPEAAIAEINGLDQAQAEGITNSLSRNDVVDLNEDHIWTLRELQVYGLTSEHLRSWQPGSSRICFNKEHRAALIHLMTRAENSLGPEEAMTEINGLSRVQAAAIANEENRDPGLSCRIM